MMYKKLLGITLIIAIGAFAVLMSPGTGNAQSAGKVTLNKATAAQLGKVPGISAALAKAIVDFRTKNGPFKKTDDLLKVPGMTAEILKKMSLKPDSKGEIFLPAGKGDGDDDDEPSLKPSKC
jgi:competence ComEA-like helix-hairpin-helix protein